MRLVVAGLMRMSNKLGRTSYYTLIERYNIIDRSDHDIICVLQNDDEHFEVKQFECILCWQTKYI